jgi:glycosyltransferase involved in cell wall biosynthesis
VGMKRGEDLNLLLDGARAVVVPSLWYENQPFSILEAFATGKPVISSDLGGMTELVRDGERGLLVPPGDVQRLAEAMQRMADNPGEARVMGDAARRYAWEVHSPDRHYQALTKIYRQVL